MDKVWLHCSELWVIQQTEQYTDDLTRAFNFLADNSKADKAREPTWSGYRQ